MKKLLVVCTFVIGLSACNASCGAKDTGVALNVEKSVRTTVVSASTLVEPLVCSVEARKTLGNSVCLKFLDVLEPTVNLAIEYNMALQSGQIPKVGETVAGISRLVEAIKSLVPASAQRDRAVQDLTAASAVAAQGR